MNKACRIFRVCYESAYRTIFDQINPFSRHVFEENRKKFRQNFEKVPKAILVCAKSMQIDALLNHFTLVGSTKDKKPSHFSPYETELNSYDF